MGTDPLAWVRDEMGALVPGLNANVVLFGSAVMLLHGIREDVGDVDLFVTRDAWSALTVRAGDRWKVRFPRAGDPPLLEWTGGRRKVHCFEQWTWRDPWIKAEQAWQRRELVQGWPCVPLALVRRWKVDSHRFNPGSPAHEKHLRDVELIDAYLKQLAAAEPEQATAEPEPGARDEAAERWGV